MDLELATRMVRKVLMIAHHFPPARGSSGIQRTLKFARYLGEHDWQPLVLSSHPRAHLQTGDDQMADIPESVPVKRAFALDSSRHLAIRGRYPGIVALPDRWSSWWLGAVPAGLALIRRHRPDAIWSTYPIATAHLIGLTLAKLTGLPWVADFRDSMTEEHYPADPQVRRVFRWIEARAVMRAKRCVFTTPGTVAMYAGRYPAQPTDRWCCIPNGYDEENFLGAASRAAPPDKPRERLELLHAGILYPSERDPRPFFAAVAQLKAEGTVSARTLRVSLRATGHDAVYRPMIDAAGIADIVELQPGIPYEAALAEMLSADGLLLFQAANCNHQIPAKLYEYLRARRPVLALTDPVGDTAKSLAGAGIDSIVRLDNQEDIYRGLQRFISQIRSGSAPVASDAVVASHSRQSRTSLLAALLNDAVGCGR